MVQPTNRSVDKLTHRTTRPLICGRSSFIPPWCCLHLSPKFALSCLKGYKRCPRVAAVAVVVVVVMVIVMAVKMVMPVVVVAVVVGVVVVAIVVVIANTVEPTQRAYFFGVLE